MHSRSPVFLVAIAALIVTFALPLSVQAGTLPLTAGPDVTLSSDYLIISRMRINGNTDVATNNFELGANKAPVPATGGPVLSFDPRAPQESGRSTSIHLALGHDSGFVCSPQRLARFLDRH